jgi:hypothetical protein
LRPATLFIAIMLAAASLRAQTLSAGAETAVNAPRYLDVTGRTQPSIASNGDGFLAVWNEGGRVYASRLDASGALVDTTRIVIGPVPSTERPAVASDGSDYVITFVDDQGLFSAKVTRGGAVTQLRVIEPGAGAHQLAMASDGASYLVTYEAADHSLHCAQLDREAGLRRDTLLTSAFVAGTRAVVASDRRMFLVAWQSGANETHVRVLDANAQPAGFDYTLPGVEPELSWDGSRYVLVRRDGALSVSIVSDGGYVREVGAIADSTAARDAAIASNGGGALVVWRDPSTNAAVAALIDSTGQEQRRDTLASPISSPWNAALASNGTRMIALTPDSATSHSLDDSFNPDPIAVEHTAAGQSSPSAATINNELLMVWTESAGRNGVEAAGMNGGTSVHGTLTVTNGPISDLSFRDGVMVGPARAAAGFRTLLATWIEKQPSPGYIVASRVSINGTVVDDRPVIISGTRPLSDPALVWDGLKYVIFASLDDGSGRGRVGAYRVTEIGQSFDSMPIPISDPTMDAVEPSAAFDGTRTLVVWSEHGSRRIAARFFTTGNAPSGPVLTLSRGFDESAPRVTTNGNGFMVVWSRANDGLYVAAVSATGTVSEPIALAPHLAIFEKSVAWNGNRYVVVWCDRSGLVTPAVYGRLVTSDGRALGRSTPIFYADGPIGQPELFAGGGEQVLLAYARAVNDATYGGADRLFIRTLLTIPIRRKSEE